MNQAIDTSSTASQVCVGCRTCSARAQCPRMTRRNQVIEAVAKWGGTAIFMAGSWMFAFVPGSGAIPLPFMVFTAGHALWLAAGIAMRDRGVAILNALFLVFDIIAITARISP